MNILSTEVTEGSAETESLENYARSIIFFFWLDKLDVDSTNAGSPKNNSMPVHFFANVTNAKRKDLKIFS